VALVLVLAFLVLITGLVLAFYTSVTTELISARTSADETTTKQMADSVVQLVMGSIATATSKGPTVAWASQPGMIRTYTNTGLQASCYKLYSSPDMVVQPSTSMFTNDVNTNWSSQPALYTDLNSPVPSSAGTEAFPIIDGNAMQTLTRDGSGLTVPAYLGYDANGDGLPDVQGFAVNPASVTYNPAAALSPTNTPVPMPVQWIYVLKDGTLTAPSGVDSTGNIANWAAASGSQLPSAANPIVGRVAFWTDDETSKVNINTAGQGMPPANGSAFWDTPHFYSATLASGSANTSNAYQFPDYAYATYQPAKYEFQRYPGHPAQVSLSPIFATAASQYMAGVTPRLVWGGSLGGTVWAGQSASLNLSQALRQPLYASADELMFASTASPPAARNVNYLSVDGSSAPNYLTQAQLEQAKFFITASSRAPEVNLFDKPRVSMWPISSDYFTHIGTPSYVSAYTTAHDRLIAFCSTLRKDLWSSGSPGYPFIFQRMNSQSPTYDYASIQRNPILYSYLQQLMSTNVPGFGGNFLAKYPAPDGNHAADSNQILTEIFDYIRCTNLSDPTLGGLPPSSNWGKGMYQFANYQNTPGTSVQLPQPYCGQVMPIQIGSATGNTMGFGRYYTVKDVSMIFICTGDGSGGPMPAPPGTGSIYQQSNDTTTNTASLTYNPSLCGTSLSTTQRRFQMALLLNYFLPSPGQLKCDPDILVRITATDPNGNPTAGLSGTYGFNVTGASNIDGGALFPAPPTASGWVAKLMPTNYSGYNPVDAVLKVRYQFLLHRSTLYNRPVYVAGYNYNYNNQIIYPFISRAFTLPIGTTLTLANPVNLQIQLFQAKGAYDNNDPALSSAYIPPGAPTYTSIIADPTDNLIQTINITIPAGSFPQPMLPIAANVANLPSAQSPQGAWGFDGRIASPYTTQPQPQGSAIIAQSGNTCYDTVRTVSVTTGDIRPIAAANLVPLQSSNLYSTGSNYSGAGSPASLHYFTDNVTPIGAQSGQMASGIYGTSAFCPPGTNAYCTSGDWDGPDVRVGGGPNDGSFINKPDEGDNMTVGQGGTSSIPYYGFAESTTTNLNLYTPNRLMPSAGMFGSLPSRVQENLATKGAQGSWQTLLFRPQASHPNAPVPSSGPPYTVIPDHLLMDLFWMPIVEPYAISEPFSTAGKINLNYQIAPFTYITRSTGLVALLKNNLMAARPSTVDQLQPPYTSFRLNINPSQNGGTLQQCAAKFAAGDIYRSASQICDLDLVPFTDPTGAPQTWSSGWGNNFWTVNGNTGDNLRERPYANIYANLTTKSNTYTVHFRVQSLRKVPATNAAQWDNVHDQVVSEYRGSSTVERYVDPDDTTLPDFAQPQYANSSLGNYQDASGNTHNAYKFRVVATKQFTP
jgi:uncharacterized protein (TIGR02600 family)